MVVTFRRDYHQLALELISRDNFDYIIGIPFTLWLILRIKTLILRTIIHD